MNVTKGIPKAEWNRIPLALWRSVVTSLDTSNNYLHDGYKFFGVGRSDTADIEEVQILNRPASALYGTAEAGGVVNLMTRKPTMRPFVALAMTGGSYTFLRPEFDLSGPLNFQKTSTNAYHNQAVSQRIRLTLVATSRPSSVCVRSGTFRMPRTSQRTCSNGRRTTR